MRFSARSKVGILLSLAAIMAVVGTFVVTAVSPGHPSHAASSTATFDRAHVKLNQVSPGPKATRSRAHTKHSSPLEVPFYSPYHGKANVSVPARSIPGVAKSHAIGPKVSNLLQNFNGLSSGDTVSDNSGLFIAVQPPDQGLCVGPLGPGSLTIFGGEEGVTVGGGTFVFEMVNESIALYTPAGTKLAETSLSDFFFSDTNVTFGDPACYFDKPSNTFFFTMQSSDLAFSSHYDIMVLNATTLAFTLYFLDTTDASNLNGNCPCFADHPHIGIDNHAFYLVGDEFQLAGLGFNGSEIFIISKSQLVSMATTVLGVQFRNLALSGVSVYQLQPAISTTSTNTEFMENSFPFDTFGNPNSVQQHIAVWSIIGDAAVTTGGFPSSINDVIITTEPYAFPMLAASTGTNTGIFPGGIFPNPGNGAFLNEGPAYDQMHQLQFINGELWSSLTTAVSIKGDVSDRDAIAWFRIRAIDATILQQGYIASAGNYLIYPSIIHTSTGSTTICFTITSPSLNPSTGYVLLGERGSTIHITAAGFNPYSPDFVFTPRWGDYSAATLDPNGKGMWMAAEYIPPLADQNLIDSTPVDNWGTEVFEVVGAAFTGGHP